MTMLEHQRSSSTYVSVPIDGNDKKAAMKEAKKIAAERLGDKTPELVNEAVVQVGVDKVPMQVKDEETGEMVMKDKEVGRFELRTTWRFTWDETPTDQAGPSPDQMAPEDSPADQ